MRVMVTGAAGRLGYETCKILAAEGHEVVALDRADRPDMPVKLHVVDLLDAKRVAELSKEIDAVAHLGNHIDFSPPDAPLIFGENMRMNINVFDGAIQGGAKQLVFASSIQAMISVPGLPDHSEHTPPPHLPIDGESPACPSNPYGLSKACGEVMLQYYSRNYGVSTLAIRYPWMHDAGKLREYFTDWRKRVPWIKRHAFAYVGYADGAAVIEAFLRAKLPGFRVYLPAADDNLLNRPAADVIREIYPDVPLRKPIEQIDRLVDTSRITAETGWRPTYSLHR